MNMINEFKPNSIYDFFSKNVYPPLRHTST